MKRAVPPAPVPCQPAFPWKTPEPLAELRASLIWADPPTQDPPWRRAGPGPTGQGGGGREGMGEGGGQGVELRQRVPLSWVQWLLSVSVSTPLSPHLFPDHLPILPASSCPGPCFPNPCRNGAECQALGEEEHRGDVFKQYICECPQGYSGIHCESSEYLGPAPAGGGGRPRATVLAAGPCPVLLSWVRASSGWVEVRVGQSLS